MMPTSEQPRNAVDPEQRLDYSAAPELGARAQVRARASSAERKRTAGFIRGGLLPLSVEDGGSPSPCRAGPRAQLPSGVAQATAGVNAPVQRIPWASNAASTASHTSEPPPRRSLHDSSTAARAPEKLVAGYM